MINNPRILVTGGSGFIGAYILRQLSGAGFSNVIATKRADSKLDHVEDITGIEWITCDLRDLGELESIFERIDIVIHAAALVSFDPRDKHTLFQHNTEVTANLVNLSLASKVKRFIFISSIATLDRAGKKSRINEFNVWKSSNESSNYAKSKYRAEMEVWRGQAEGMDTIILNPGIVLGAGYWSSSSTKIFDYIWNNGRFVSKGESGFIDVRDVAKIAVEAININTVNKRYILVAENLSYRSLFKMISDSLGKAMPERTIPFWMGAIIWRFSILWARITNTSPLITKETFRSAYSKAAYDNRLSVQTFKFTYTPIQQTISDTAALLKDSKAKNINFGILPI